MKFARFRCYGCRQEYNHIFPKECHTIECPCGQWNNVPDDAWLITGICGDCGRAMDDHNWNQERGSYEYAHPVQR